MSLSMRAWLSFGLAIIVFVSFSTLAIKRDATFHGLADTIHIARSPEKLWFTPAGDFWVVFSEGLTLDIQRFSEKDQTPSWTCKLNDRVIIPGSTSLPRGLGKDDRERVSRDLRARADTREISAEVLHFAISREGQRIAWAWEGRLWTGLLAELCSKNPNNEKLTSVEIDPKPVAGIQLEGDSANPIVVALFEEGEVVVQRPGDVTATFSLAKAFRPSSLVRWVFSSDPGEQVTLTAPDSARIAFVTAAPKPTWSSLDLGITNPTAIHRLSDSDLFVGTETGVLVHRKSADEHPKSDFYTVPALQAIRVISTYSPDDAVVGGDFRSLVWIRKDRTTRVIATTPKPITGLALSKSRLAYSYAGGMSLANLTWSLRFSEAGRSKLSWMLSIIGILGFLRAICADRKIKEPQNPLHGEGSILPGTDGENIPLLAVPGESMHEGDEALSTGGRGPAAKPAE